MTTTQKYAVIVTVTGHITELKRVPRGFSRLLLTLS